METPISYESIEEKLMNFDIQFDGTQIPMPDWWGGYRIEPVRFEFWQGRSNYLHDRFEYCNCTGSKWNRQRIAP